MGPAEKARKLVKAFATRVLDFEYSGMPCRLENVSRQKLQTLVNSQINCRRSRPKRPWYPIQLHVETSSACGLSCPLCPAGMGLVESPRGLMGFPTFRALMDEVGNHTVSALLWGWGEPFMNRKLTDMIAYARSKNVATIVSTNGQHIGTRDEAEQVVASGLDCLIVSMDGATQETYSGYRVGGDIQKVLRCLELMGQAKTSLGSDKPVVNVQTVVLKQNEHELAQIESIARKHGADMISRVSSHMPDYAGTQAEERFAPDDIRYRRFDIRNGKRVRRSICEYKCIRPWDRMTVTHEGTVTSCEHDFNSTVPLGGGGNGNSFTDAWWGERASQFRRQFLMDKSVYSFCADCHYRDNTKQCLVEVVRLRETRHGR